MSANMCGDMFLIYKNCPDDESHHAFPPYCTTLMDIVSPEEGSELVEKRMCPERMKVFQEKGFLRWCIRDKRANWLREYRTNSDHRYLVDDDEGCYARGCCNRSKIITWKERVDSLHMHIVRQDLARRFRNKGKPVDLWTTVRRNWRGSCQRLTLRIFANEREGVVQELVREGSVLSVQF